MRAHHRRGFTLVELMIVVAIVAIAAAIALPSFQSSIRSNRVATQTNELMGSISLARSEAIRSPGGAAICASADGAGCNGNWQSGWLVWIEDRTTADGVPNASERVIRFVAGNDRMTLAASNSSTGDPTRLRFDNRGRLVEPGNTTLLLRPSDCPSGTELVRSLVVSQTGQLRMTKGGCT